MLYLINLLCKFVYKFVYRKILQIYIYMYMIQSTQNITKAMCIKMLQNCFNTPVTLILKSVISKWIHVAYVAIFSTHLSQCTMQNIMQSYILQRHLISLSNHFVTSFRQDVHIAKYIFYLINCIYLTI